MKHFDRVAVVCIAALLGGLTLPASGAPRCSIHPPEGASDAKLQSMTKISKSQAERQAAARLAHMGHVSPSSAELEAEHGCLIWSFDMKIAGHSGVEEVNVDAGNGRVLNVHHETPRAEAAEAKSK